MARPMIPDPKRRRIRQLPGVTKHYRVQSTTAATTTIRAPSVGNSLRLRRVHLSAKGVVAAYLRFKNHTQPDQRIVPTFLEPNASYAANLVGAEIEGDVDESLELVTDAAQTVDCMVAVDEIPGGVIGEEEQS